MDSDEEEPPYSNAMISSYVERETKLRWRRGRRAARRMIVLYVLESRRLPFWLVINIKRKNDNMQKGYECCT